MTPRMLHRTRVMCMNKRMNNPIISRSLDMCTYVRIAFTTIMRRYVRGKAKQKAREAKDISNTQVGEVHTPPAYQVHGELNERAVTFPF